MFVTFTKESYNTPSSIWDGLDFFGSLALGPWLIYVSIVGALWVKNKLPHSEQLWLRRLERKKRSDEEQRHKKLLMAERLREYEAEQVEESRQRIAQLPVMELKYKEEKKADEERQKAEDERRRGDKAYNEQKKTLQYEILSEKRAVKRKLDMEALIRNKATAERDAKDEYEAQKAQDAAAWAAAHPPKTTESSDVSKHLSDKQIEKLALKAFRRISSLSRREQEEAWQDWEDSLSGEYDNYIEAEIIARVQELRGEE